MLSGVIELSKGPKSMKAERRLIKRRASKERRLLSADRHHVLFQKRFWSLPDYNLLRCDPDLVVTMDIMTHRQLHSSVPPVPPLGSRLTTQVLQCYLERKAAENSPRHNVTRSPLAGIKTLEQALDDVLSNNRIAVTDLEALQINIILMNLHQQLRYIRQSDQILRERREKLSGLLDDANEQPDVPAETGYINL